MNPSTHEQPLSLTMCICTANRPQTLARCLASIAAGSVAPARVLVSDDSPDGAATRAVCEAHGVDYLPGPRRGLCANRNWIIRNVTTSHLSLVDDDAIVSHNFVEEAMRVLKPPAEKEILTGNLQESGVPVDLCNGSFWGHFTQPATHRRETIHLNSNIFPRNAFDVAEFDESIVYGYEDMDLCNCLLAKGFHIRQVPQLLNNHARPDGIPVKRLRQKEQARFYISLKRYLLWEKSLPSAVLYTVLAPLQRAAHSAKVKDWGDLPHCLPDMMTALRDISRERRRLRSLPAAS